jgi:hypothetical protein
MASFIADPAHNSDLQFLRIRILSLTFKRVRIRLPEMIRIRNSRSDETEIKGAQISKQNVGENEIYVRSNNKR